MFSGSNDNLTPVRNNAESSADRLNGFIQKLFSFSLPAGTRLIVHDHSWTTGWSTETKVHEQTRTGAQSRQHTGSMKGGENIQEVLMSLLVLLHQKL